MLPSFQNLSIRAKLALILGFTIFALAGTRALGLAQLGAFLQRFDAYTSELESAQGAMLALRAAHRALAHAASGNAGSPAVTAASPADKALAALERVARPAGLDPERVRSLREDIRAGALPREESAAALDQLAERLEARFGERRKRAAVAYADESRIMNATYVSMLVLVLGAGGIAYVLIVRMVTRPLGRMAEVADTVASGDLRSLIDTSRGDELGHVMRALDGMNRELAALIGRVRGVSTEIQVRSSEIDLASTGLSERVAGQAAALQQTAAALEQLTKAVASNAEHARRASKRADGASSIAEKGGEGVRRVMETMGAIDAGARRVAEITRVIDGIAFQTNLLAINAAVEAARAGESGRGFAVVATQVRELAQECSASAREIKGLIEDALGSVADGGAAVRAAGTTMSEIVAAAREVTSIIAQIAAASAEQSRGLQQVNRALEGVEQKTRQNAGLVDRAAHCARAMRDEAADLHAAVKVFRLADEPHHS